MVVVYCVLALFAKAARTQRNMAGVLILVLAVFTVTSFGNIFLQGKYMCGMLSGLLVTELVYAYIQLSFVLPVFVAVMFTLLHALIQTYVLTMLTALFYGEVSEPHAAVSHKKKG